MLKRLSIKNFQSHKTTTMILTSDDRIVSIVGSSDSGKSAYMRALRYLYLLDTAYPRAGALDMSVKVWTDDYNMKRYTTYSPTRKKLKDMIKIDGIEEPWKKFHKELPDGVKEKTKIFNLAIPDLKYKFSLNFVDQRDQLLPLALKPSQISKLLGSITGRNVIDSAIRETNVAIKQLNSEKKAYELANQSLEESLDKLKATIPDHKPDMTEIVDMLYESDWLSELSHDLSRLDGEIAKLTKQKRKMDKALDSCDIADITEKLEDLKQVVQLSQKMRDIPDEELPDVPDLTDIDEMLKKQRDELALMVELTGKVKEIVDNKSKLKETEDEFKDVTVQIQSILTKTKVCPYSGESLPKNCIKALAGS